MDLSFFFKSTFFKPFSRALYFLFFLNSCIPVKEDPNDRCPPAIPAAAVGIEEVYFSPFKNQRSATSSDTVPLSQFGYKFKLNVSRIQASDLDEDWSATQDFCEETFQIRNISNISVVLTAPFAGLPIGTDISYALITPNGKNISQLREFENVSVFFGSKLNLRPAPFSQLKTRIFVFLRDGRQASLESTSPYLKID